MEEGATFGRIDYSGVEMFHSLRQSLGVTSFGMNVISLRPGQRLRIHRHERQEEVYIVLRGTLTLVIEGEERSLSEGNAARVAPSTRRQLTNRDRELCVVLALGAAGEHEGRDGVAFTSWEETQGRPPQEVPLPEDLPVD